MLSFSKPPHPCEMKEASVYADSRRQRESAVSISTCSAQIRLKIVELGGVVRWLTAKWSLEIVFIYLFILDRQRKSVADS